MKAVKNERHQAENVEMNRARGVPAARENKKTDKEIQQRRDSEVIFNRGGVLLRRGDERYFERLAVAANSVAYLRPRAGAPEQFGYVGGAMDLGSMEGFDVVALFDAGAVSRSAGSHMPSGNAAGGVQPGDAVIGNDEARALL